MQRETKSCLTLFWNGSEAPGMMFYAYPQRREPQSPEFPSHLWPANSENKRFILTGEEWVVWMWELRLPSWPADWTDVVNKTLVELVGHGDGIAWCGLEGGFLDPPDLLDPSLLEDSIYAALLPNKQFACRTTLDGQFVALTEEQVQILRDYVLRHPHNS